MLASALREALNFRALTESSYRRKLFSRIAIVSLRRIPASARARLFRGEKFHCPVCDRHVRRFLAWGRQENIWCPVCTSFDRHRFAWLFFQRKTDLLDGRAKKMLHIAPEQSFERKLAAAANLDYITADLMNPKVTMKMDITDIKLPDATFDVIYCSHVLEHVPDPPRALRELLRVLKPSGWAALAVPLFKGPTIGDPSITSPKERERLFGQHDHFWRFGPDFRDMIADAGFEVEAVRAADIADAGECDRMALPRNEPIFLCRPPARPAAGRA